MKQIVKKIFRSMGFDIARYPYTDITPHLDYLHLLNQHNVDIVLDVGANIGQYAGDLFKLGYKGKIISFEPMSREYALLKKAGEKNEKWVVAEQMAIGNANGFIEINISENSVSSSILPLSDYAKENSPSTKYVAKEKVRISKISDMAKIYASDAKNLFLKIDVQGFEEQVLEGAADLVPQLIGIHLEFSLKPLYETEKSMEEILLILKKYNFDPCYFIPHPTKDKIGKMMQIDGVFFKK